MSVTARFNFMSAYAYDVEGNRPGVLLCFPAFAFPEPRRSVELADRAERVHNGTVVSLLACAGSFE